VSLRERNVPNALEPRSPDFIGIGVQKGGTWWLRANLGRHPGVWMPPLPELHYFDRPLPGGVFPPAAAGERLADPERLAAAVSRSRRSVAEGVSGAAAWWAMHEFLDHDDDWYRLLFSLAPAECLVGEITPRYAILGDAEIAHMHAVAPEAKLVLLLRDPVDRFWSQCRMKHADGSLGRGDPAAMQLFDTPNGRPRGEYSATILRYCRRFDPSRMLVVFHEGLAREPRRTLREVCGFLGIAAEPVDDDRAGLRVNDSPDRSPMPETLRGRIAAAYQAEKETLAEVFGGHAAGWLGDDSPAAAAAAVRLTAAHVDALAARARARRPGRRPQVFCVSMQRSGTTSVGDWLEAHGLRRAGSPTSVRLGWTRLWFEGRHEELFACPEFRAAEILEDDPWWCAGFHRVLAARFPDAKFVLLTRDSDDWFDSLCHHSGGQNPGWSDVHARNYGREEELRRLLGERPETNPAAWGLLPTVGRAAHYKAVYERHTTDVQATFAASPERLFTGRLDDPGVFAALCDFVGVRLNPRLPIPRANARTAEMERRLAARRSGEAA
jgi:hypothetical protein